MYCRVRDAIASQFPASVLPITANFRSVNLFMMSPVKCGNAFASGACLDTVFDIRRYGFGIQFLVSLSRSDPRKGYE